MMTCMRLRKFLKSEEREKNVQYLVKWPGYPDKFNSWVSASEINKV